MSETQAAPSMWQAFSNVASRTWKNLLVVLSTSTLSIVIGFVIPAACFLIALIPDLLRRRQTGMSVLVVIRSAILDWKTITSTFVLIVVWGSLILWVFLKTVLRDEIALSDADRKHKELSQKLESNSQTTETITQYLASVSRGNTLQQKIFKAAHGILAFVRENPNPAPYSDSYWEMSEQQMREQMEKVSLPYAKKLCRGFDEKFRADVLSIIGELHDKSIQDEKLNSCLSAEISDEGTLRIVAERLLIVAANLYSVTVS